MENKGKIKTLKISDESHKLLKKFCVDNGLKMHKFIENLISKNCKSKKEIYGE